MGIDMRALPARAAYRTYRLLSPLYYHALYGRRLPPFMNRWVRAVSRWEAQWRGDVPLRPEVWDRQYAAGKWRYMAGLAELGRYSMLAGYLRWLKPRGVFLDVGCGEGLLARRLGSESYAAYLGIDVSAAAIVQARAHADPATQFVRADAELYVPERRFDAMIFNECLYYFHDPMGTLERYLAALTPGGIAVMSNYLGSMRATRLVQRLKHRYAPLDECTVAHDAHAWHCMVIDPVRRH